MKKVFLYEELINLSLKIEKQFNKDATDKINKISKKHKIKKVIYNKNGENTCAIN